MNNLETYHSYPTPLLSTVLGLFNTHLQTLHCSYEGATVIVICEQVRFVDACCSGSREGTDVPWAVF